jgi:hypothetical protein
MDADRFDRLAKVLSRPGTRRGLTRLLAAFPLGVTVATLLGTVPGTVAEHRQGQPHDDDHGSSHRRQRRKARHRHDPGQDLDQHKDNPTRKGKDKGKKTCTPKSRAKTCAGTCGTVRNSCGKRVECGACTCATGCHPVCQRCNPATGLCDPVTNGTGCDDGDDCTQTDTCQNGSCVGGTAVVCPAADECHDPGTCDPATGDCSNPNKTNGTACTDGFCCGGGCKECCSDQDCPSGYCHGHKVCAPKACTQDDCDSTSAVVCGRDVNSTIPCRCFKRADTGDLFCSAATLGPCDAGTCPSGQACVALHAPQCGNQDVCAIPCTHPS